jgi:hypothetical protein
MSAVYQISRHARPGGLAAVSGGCYDARMKRFARSALWGVVIVTTLAGCGWWRSAPEARAEDVVRLLVNDPESKELAALVAGPSPAALASGPAEETALVFLRARLRMGATLDYEAHRLSASGTPVTVRVSVTDRAAARPVVLRVTVDQHPERGWLVSAIHSE